MKNDFNKKEREIKSLFGTYFDGSYGIEPQDSACTYSMGLCKLEYIESKNTLVVHLRRPGLLIGKAGRTINSLKDWLGCEIAIVEVELF